MKAATSVGRVVVVVVEGGGRVVVVPASCSAGSRLVTKTMVSTTIARMISGRIQRPCFGSGFRGTGKR